LAELQKFSFYTNGNIVKESTGKPYVSCSGICRFIIYTGYKVK